MTYLVLGVALVLFLMWGVGGRQGLLKRPEWRIGAAVFAAGAFAACAYMLLRRQWVGAVIMLILGLWLTMSARYPRAPRPAAQRPSEKEISEAEALSILDLEPGASRDEIEAAYRRLMKLIHPDKGGGKGLATRLNAARDRLLKGR